MIGEFASFSLPEIDLGHGTTFLERDWRQVASVIGVIALGMAYIPLAPATPLERLRMILSAANPIAVITEPSLAQLCRDVGGNAVLFDAVSAYEATSSVPAMSDLPEEAPAYLIFTSGSTAVPKGVTIGHESLLNAILFSNRHPGLKQEDVVLGITALHHDLSVYDIFGTLTAGAKLVLPSKDIYLPEEWIRLVRKDEVTFWNSVPIPYADFVTSSTTKTFCGSRGGLILCKDEPTKKLDRGVFPKTISSIHLATMAVNAFALRHAGTSAFRSVMEQVIHNARTLAAELERRDFRIVSGGTDNHIVLVDTRNKRISGRELQDALEYVSITVNKNLIPFDRAPPKDTSGIRIGLTSVSQRGLKDLEIKEIASIIHAVTTSPQNPTLLGKCRARVRELIADFSLYTNAVYENDLINTHAPSAHLNTAENMAKKTPERRMPFRNNRRDKKVAIN